MEGGPAEDFSPRDRPGSPAALVYLDRERSGILTIRRDRRFAVNVFALMRENTVKAHFLRAGSNLSAALSKGICRAVSDGRTGRRFNAHIELLAASIYQWNQPRT